MNTLLALSLLLLVQAPAPANPDDYGSFAGTIIWASQSRPLEGIPVYLIKSGENVQDAQKRGVAISDAAGRFLLKDVPPGQYRVVAGRRGYSPLPDQPPTQIIVAPKAAVKDVPVRMLVGGSITGRILDPNGVGLANIMVGAGPLNYSPSGKRDLGFRSNALSDERGEYRIWG